MDFTDASAYYRSKNKAANQEGIWLLSGLIREIYFQNPAIRATTYQQIRNRLQNWLLQDCPCIVPIRYRKYLHPVFQRYLLLYYLNLKYERLFFLQ